MYNGNIINNQVIEKVQDSGSSQSTSTEAAWTASEDLCIHKLNLFQVPEINQQSTLTWPYC